MSENVNWYTAKLTDGMYKPQRGRCYVAGTGEQHARKVAEEYYPDNWMDEVVRINEADMSESDVRDSLVCIGSPNIMIEADGTVIRRSDLKE